jgi:hypothetical protein
MLKRIAIAFVVTFLALALIDRASLFVQPCGIGGGGYSEKGNPGDDDCAIRQAIVLAGFEWLREQPPEFWTALATIAVAFFTLTLWLSSEKMWQITSESLALARNEFQSSHRPKMRLKHVYLTHETNWRVGGPLEVVLEFVNIGNSPARITWINYESILLRRNERLPQRPPYDETPFGPEMRITRFRTEGILPSGLTMSREVCDGRIINDHDIREIMFGEQCLYLIGTIEYWDAAGLRRAIAESW